MKVAIIGYAVEGQSAYRYWRKLGADITICDAEAATEVPEGVKTQLGDDYLHNLSRFDVVVRSPGIHPSILLKGNPDTTNKITTTIDEFLRVCPTKHTIGVTGTKGKGTTATLITRMLEATGKRVFLGGNIGIAPLDFLDKITADSWVVLELSSFQLYDVRHSPSIAVCLTIGLEHLDWHGDADDYIRSKTHMFDHQQTKDLAIYYAPNATSKQIADHSPGHKLPYFIPPGAYIKDGGITIADQKICRTSELQLLGEHNWQNVCAATTVVWEITQDIGSIRAVLTSFTGLEHRLEFVREINNVKFYNDSYASGPDSAIAAINAIPGPKVLIIGGFERNIPLTQLAETINDHANEIRKVVVIGTSGQRVIVELTKAGFTNFSLEPSKQMGAIVARANSYAQEGDSVILSPGFASFDMFKNFTDRGLQFKAAVGQL
jgi:UDP-N-acetylmuramoylalanine--D-glutamate ligase